ncbi:MFS transporter [Paraburkholderia acidiphila]|uniref:MFS transporter n=1 Tax=Paraburkholderia acidiphila TaxID=2571747 RepID=A0A7Z2JAW7_9BURK|nr:hypothetical protein [Paraburkholderia acidiphila]QGZ56889.1 hypothetical protein FAZ97_18210 [Paraburkholderia acidiphila]
MDMKELRVVASSCAAACVGNATWWMQPVLMHQLVTTDGMSESLAGLVITIEMLSLSLGSALLNRLIGERTPLFGVALWGTVVAIVGAFLAVFWEHHTSWLILARLAVGAGAGAAFMASNRLAARTRVPESTFATLGIVNVVYGIVLIGLLPHIGISMETGSFKVFVIAIVMLLPVVLFTPRTVYDSGTTQTVGFSPEQLTARGGVSGRIAVIAAGSWAIGLCSGIIWVFYWIIGERAGMSSVAIESAVTASIVAAGVGSTMAAVIGAKFGRARPACVGLAILAASVLTLSSHPAEFGFRVAACLQLSAIYFLFPFLQAAAAAEDPSGVGASYVGSAFFTAGALAPLVGSIVVQYIGFGLVAGAIVVVAVVLGLALLLLERRSPAVVSRVIG